MIAVETVRLAPHVRLRFDDARGRHVLLSPETVAVLNATSADVLALCDGRTVDDVVAALRERYDHVEEADVRAFVARMTARRCLEVSDG